MAKQITGAIQQMCDSVKTEVLKLSDKTGFVMYTGISYLPPDKDNIYYVKIQISKDDTGYIHVKISKPSTNDEPQCLDVMKGQTNSDPLTPF